MIFSNLKIGRRLTIGFSIVMILSLATSIFAVFQIKKIWSNTQNLYEHPYQVGSAIRDVRINILNIRRFMLHIALNPKEYDFYINLIDEEEKNAFTNLEKINNLYLGDKTEIDILKQEIIQWKSHREEAFINIKNNNNELAINLILNKNLKVVNNILAQSQKTINFSSKKAESFYLNALKSEQKALLLLIFILAFSFLTSIVFAYLITKSISKPLLIFVKKLKDISRGNLSNEKLAEGYDEIGQLAVSYNLMLDNLSHKAYIADQIAQGKYDQRVDAISSNDVLANAVNQIAKNFTMVVKQARKVAMGDLEVEFGEMSQNHQLVAVINSMVESLKNVVNQAREVAQGNFSSIFLPRSDADELAIAINSMTESLNKMTIENNRRNKLKSAQNDINELIRGDMSPEILSKNIVSYITKFLKAQIGAFYLYNNEQKCYQLSGSYAFNYRKGVNNSFKSGEGIIGQAASEQQIITFNNLPDDYFHISSGLGESIPRYVLVAPFIYNNETIGVIELGSFNEFDTDSYEFLNSVIENIAIALVSAESRDRMAKLLSVTKEQSEELQVQQEELRQTNEELEAQTKALRKSEEYLQTQQEELRVTNEELEEKTRNLENQKRQIEDQNSNLNKVRIEVEQKARELEVTNKYKSEFLANMSHELRTPLNSLLILSQSLAENRKGNLSNDQIESANIIFNSGNDLLNLINDILDLSKIESGKMKLNYAPTHIVEIEHSIKSYFEHVLLQKGLEYTFTVENNVPSEINSDEQRLNQILRNLVSNAIKFTSKGHVDIRIFKPDSAEDLSKSGLKPDSTVAISVKDTGIGIAKEKQTEIFEAFLQADGSISRKYGGTGLGLSITRELTKLLGGEIKLNSESGKGSEFIIFLPIDSEHLASVKLNKELPAAIPPQNVPIIRPALSVEQKKVITIPSITDDRQITTSTDKCLLIIEDDNRFAEILADMCRQKGFKCIATAMGEEALELAKKYLPKGIILDINLPGIDGWEVLQILKNAPETRHIPVHIMSGHEETIDAFNRGAIGYLTKPATKEKIEAAFEGMQNFISKDIKDLLIIEDDDHLRKSIHLLLSSSDINIAECNSGEQAIKLISEKKYDCVVLDLGLPDMTGFELLKKLTSQSIKIPPVVVYTGREITNEENEQLQKYTQNIIIKGVKSHERLLDETALFLHRMVDTMPDSQKKMLIHLYDKDQIFNGKQILVVDDDMRNVFALTQVLEAAKMKVTMAPNGEKAIEQLNNDNSIDLVLMDIMMPVMDGYEAMQQIRKNKKFEKLPIIALTAKAMKEDREKTIAAGANDYLSKPVDVQKLFNLMRIWLYQ